MTWRVLWVSIRLLRRRPRGQAARFSMESLEYIYRKLLAIDEGVKTSQITLDLAMDTLVVELTR